MRITILPSGDGDFAPARPASIYDINQLRMNSVVIEHEGETLNLELNLAEWTISLTKLLKAAIEHGSASLSEMNSFAGETFEGEALAFNTVILDVYDWKKKERFKLQLDWDNALRLHQHMTEALEHVLRTSELSLNEVGDSHLIRMQ